MIVLHESMPEEAGFVAGVLKDYFRLDCSLVDWNLDGLFSEIPCSGGYFDVLLRHPLPESRGKAILVLTNKDLYIAGSSSCDDWIFGFNLGEISLVSAARLKRADNMQSRTLEVPREKYLQRVAFMALHEIGHDVVKGAHLRDASYVNPKTGYTAQLGKHCLDHSCVLYEIIDVRAPDPSEGFLRIGEESRFDAGLDDVIERLHEDWFCRACSDSIVIDEKYF